MKTIMYDATILAQGLLDRNIKTGIYFVCKNILLELLKRKDINTICYLKEDLMSSIDNLRKSEKEFENIKFFGELSGFQKKLSVLIIDLKELRRGKNFFIKNVLNLNKLILSIALKLVSESRKSKLSKINYYFSGVYKTPAFIKKEKKIKRFTVSHDMIPLLYPDNYPDNKTGSSWFLALMNSLDKDDNIITVSDCSKRDIIKLNKNIDKNKVFTSYLATSKTFYQCKDKKRIAKVLNKYGIPKNAKYIFSLCTLEPRKNLVHSIKCFIEMIKKNKVDDLYFVLGGGHWVEFKKLLDKEIDNLDKYKDKIIKIGYVDDKDLAPLYSEALFFVYASLYEGFGLPVLEAMKCGTPVITSNTSSLPEVIGKAGIMIDPKNKKELIGAMYQMYNDRVLRKKLSKKGLERAKLFTWEKTVETIINNIKK